jgi:hypothetical protein
MTDEQLKKAVEWLLAKEYVGQFEREDGYLQDPRGLNFEEWKEKFVYGGSK